MPIIDITQGKTSVEEIPKSSVLATAETSVAVTILEDRFVCISAQITNIISSTI